MEKGECRQSTSCPWGPRPSPRAGLSVKCEQHPVVDAPEEVRPVRPVPEPRQAHREHEAQNSRELRVPAKFATEQRAAHRKEEVIPEPGRQCDVPSMPELG